MYLFLCIPIGKFNGLDVFIDFLLNENYFINRFPSYGSIINEEFVNTLCARIQYNPQKNTDEIFVHAKYLLLPKPARQLLLWHEYGHNVLGDTTISVESSEHYSEHIYENISKDMHYHRYRIMAREVMVDFYVCCKLKLSFKQFCNLEHKIDKIFGEKDYSIYQYNFEERHEQFKKDLDYSKIEDLDILYSFYENPAKLIEMYNTDYNILIKDPNLQKELEIKKLYLEGIISKTDYMVRKRNSKYRGEKLKRFDWNKLLNQCGWNDKEERLKFLH